MCNCADAGNIKYFGQRIGWCLEKHQLHPAGERCLPGWQSAPVHIRRAHTKAAENAAEELNGGAEHAR